MMPNDFHESSGREAGTIKKRAVTSKPSKTFLDHIDEFDVVVYLQNFGLFPAVLSESIHGMVAKPPGMA